MLGNFSTCDSFESSQNTVTVNSLSQHVELTEPVHIVIYDNPKTFHLTKFERFDFVKISGLRRKLLRAALNILGNFSINCS